MTTLCTMCNATNANSYNQGDCFVCNNELENIDNMVKQACEMIVNENCESFAISTKLPDKWLIREEELWDKKLSNVESLKNSVNRKLIKSITELSGKKYDPIDGEIRVVFDFNKNKLKNTIANRFIFGKYKKNIAGISQSRWVCKKCNGTGCANCNETGKNYVSVEEKIGEVFKKHSKCSSYVIHASGREDVDVINIAGRAFVLELFNVKNMKFDLKRIADEVNQEKHVEIEKLKLVNRAAVELISNSHFDKEYEAEIETEKNLVKDDLKPIIDGMILLNQRTPIRVAHRRSDLIRQRQIKNIVIDAHNENKLKIRILAEAGTYIKEFITGDEGRTKPSITSLLNCKAKCLNLKVIKIHDEFFDLCI